MSENNPLPEFDISLQPYILRIQQEFSFIPISMDENNLSHWYCLREEKRLEHLKLIMDLEEVSIIETNVQKKMFAAKAARKSAYSPEPILKRKLTKNLLEEIVTKKKTRKI